MTKQLPSLTGQLYLTPKETRLVPDKKWRAPRDPEEQAWKLREYLRTGKHQLVLICERTRQVNPDNFSSPVQVCTPENCNEPCFNCMLAILTGKKAWLWDA
jgi:hypothetical protein